MKRIVLVSSVCLVFILATGFVVFSTGVANKTGSPSEGTCFDCHTGGGGGTTTMNIFASPAFNSGQYIPGQTYTINVSVNNSTATKFGFDTEILNSANSDAGQIISALSGAKIVNGARTNVIHNAPKIGAGTATFQFVWKAPASDLVKIYASVNALSTLLNGAPSFSVLTLTPDISTGINYLTASSNSGLSIYPNPATSNFTISYYLSERADVRLSITDIQGRVVHQIANEQREPGVQELKVQLPDDVEKGIYFVKLLINNNREIKQMMIKQ